MPHRGFLLSHSATRVPTSLEMAASDKGGKRRRRKRKKADPPAAPPTTVKTTTTQAAPSVAGEKKPSAASMAAEILAQESMMYDEDDFAKVAPQKLEEDDRIAAAARKAGYDVGGGGAGGAVTPGTELEDLFDSREFLQRKREKAMEDQSTAGKPSSVIPTRKKIKRSDVKAYEKLLEMDPLADEDDSYFEDEGIDFISALLGDVEPGVGDDSDENKNKSGKGVQKKTSARRHGESVSTVQRISTRRLRPRNRLSCRAARAAAPFPCFGSEACEEAPRTRTSRGRCSAGASFPWTWATYGKWILIYDSWQCRSIIFKCISIIGP